MRVALVSDCFPPRLGGIEVQVQALATHLADAGHEVEVVTATAGPGGESAGQVTREGAVNVHRYAVRLPWGPLQVPANVAAGPVRALLRDGGFDVVHAHMGVVSPFAQDGVRVALGLGLPTAVTWHCVLDRSRPLLAALGFAARWARRGAALSAVSTMAADRVRAIAGGAEVSVLGNGLDLGAWARPEDRPRVPDAPLRLVSALRLARRKRPEALVEVVAAAAARLPAGSLRLTVLGEGPLRPTLERLVAERGLGESVRFAGRVDRTALREAYWDSHLYLSTVELEAFGLAALEARAAGLPVLARTGTGIADFVRDGVDGLLRPSDAGLAEAVVELVRDPVRLAALTAAARGVVPAHDWSDLVGATLAEYARAGAR